MPEETESDAARIPTEQTEGWDANHSSDAPDSDEGPEGGKKPEAVEDRPNVGTVEPEDYPKDQPDS